MTLKEQINKIKENWLLLVLVLVVLVVVSVGKPSGLSLGSLGGDYYDSGYSKSFAAERSYYPVQESFAPDVVERVIIKSAYLTTEVERGTFKDSETKLKSIVKASDSFILDENVNKYESKRKSYYAGSYQIKVDAKKYDSVISQIKEIGEVKGFSENMNDVTGSYTDTKIEIAAEKERLERFKKLYDEATVVEDKIILTDKIFDQERRVKYLEESLANIDERVDYSTISVTINEKRSEYADVEFVKFSELIRSLVSSFNSLWYLVFVSLPWIIVLIIVRFVYRKFW